MDSAKLRAWWWHRQGLDGSLSELTPAEVLERTGWARSVGGVGPYLTLNARIGTTRAQADAAVAALDISELPSARGCTYVLPACHFALGLKAAVAMGVPGDLRTALKLGCTVAEIEGLAKTVTGALEAGPLSPDEIRAAVGDEVRSFGKEGARQGLTSTLPVALEMLQGTGGIRRVPVDGRLDQQRYRYALWRPGPLESCSLSPAEALTELARLYFAWIGPATPAEFQWFSGVGVKTARAAMAPLGLVSLSEGDPRLLFPGDLAALQAFQPPREPRYALVSSLDGLTLLRRNVADLLEPGDAEGLSLGGLKDLPSHGIFDRGRLVGLWEYDAASQSIAWASFIPGNAELKRAVARTEEFVRTELGDARAFSLDSPTSRQPRIEALRRAGKR